MFNQKIKHIYFVDKLEILYTTKNKRTNQPPQDLEIEKLNKLSDNSFREAYSNDIYIMGINNKWNSGEDEFKIKIVIKNQALYETNFVATLKELKNKYDLDFNSYHLDISLDTDTNLNKLFEEVSNNPDKYKIHKCLKTKQFQETYEIITIGSTKNFHFKLYNKTKEIKHIQKHYISAIHQEVFGKNKTIYRLELRLKPQHCKDIRLNPFLLNEQEYLKQIFKTFFQDRFEIKIVNPSDKNSARWKTTYLFDINGDTCIRKTKINKTEFQEKKTKGTNHLKTIVKSLNDLYSIHQKMCFSDSIIELCINNNDLKVYVNKIIKDDTILNKINDADDFELF
jgi:uncharacterized pyridoxamine 5'-phosphate oxidase family protein